MRLITRHLMSPITTLHLSQSCKTLSISRKLQSIIWSERLKEVLHQAVTTTDTSLSLLCWCSGSPLEWFTLLGKWEFEYQHLGHHPPDRVDTDLSTEIQLLTVTEKRTETIPPQGAGFSSSLASVQARLAPRVGVKKAMPWPVLVQRRRQRLPPALAPEEARSR